MTWNNRIFRRKYDSGNPSFTIHEAYYDANGKLDGWTENAIEPRGESVEELIEHLQQMLNDAKRSKQDILDYDELERKSKAS